MDKKLILLSGKIGSGKNQMAKYLEEIFKSKGLSVTQDLFAQDLKAMCGEDFKLLSDVLKKIVDTIMSNIGIWFDFKATSSAYETHIETLLKSLTFNTSNFYEDKTDITRALLQIYGTDIFRNRVDERFWTKLLADRINSCDSDIIIITDLRFENEINSTYDYITNRRIIPIRIDRPSIDRSDIKNTHISEVSLDDYPFFEYIIENIGTLSDLHSTVDILVSDIINS